MGGIYSGKNLISYDKKSDDISIINHKDEKTLNFWKGNIFEYKKLKDKKYNTFYIINTPMNEVLSKSIYDINDNINGDIYSFIDKQLNSFTPDISFKAISVLNENYYDEISIEPIYIKSYDDIYNKYINNQIITGSALIKKIYRYGEKENFYVFLESFIFENNTFKFIFSTNEDIYYSMENNQYGCPQYYLILDSDNNITISYDLI